MDWWSRLFLLGELTPAFCAVKTYFLWAPFFHFENVDTFLLALLLQLELQKYSEKKRWNRNFADRLVYSINHFNHKHFLFWVNLSNVTWLSWYSAISQLLIPRLRVRQAVKTIALTLSRLISFWNRVVGFFPEKSIPNGIFASILVIKDRLFATRK